MKKVDKEMLTEYDFTGREGVRGKYSKAYKAGHSVKIYDGSELISDKYFAAIEPDVREYFPDSKTINTALRKVISLFPKKTASSRR
jgi:hypothetical protein